MITCYHIFFLETSHTVIRTGGIRQNQEHLKDREEIQDHIGQTHLRSIGPIQNYIRVHARGLSVITVFNKLVQDQENGIIWGIRKPYSHACLVTKRKTLFLFLLKWLFGSAE
jgi:hypothetical protein